jgi:hypothetical protein
VRAITKRFLSWLAKNPDAPRMPVVLRIVSNTGIDNHTCCSKGEHMELNGVQKKAAPKGGRKFEPPTVKSQSDVRKGLQTPQPLREDPHVKQLLEAFRLRVG